MGRKGQNFPDLVGIVYRLKQRAARPVVRVV
jgi:hypothetical protein